LKTFWSRRSLQSPPPHTAPWVFLPLWRNKHR
jgi:hypothetical protein